MECQVHLVLPNWINQEECSLPKKGWSFGREGNQPRFLWLGINIKVLVVIHTREIHFHTFGQVFGTWLKRLSNQKPGLTCTKIEHWRQLLTVGAEWVDWDLFGMGPWYMHGLDNFLHLFYWESCFFISLSSQGPLSPQYSLKNI